MLTDKEIVLDPNEWPAWPFLPFTRKLLPLTHKKRGWQEDNCGFMIEQQNFPPFIIYIGSFYRYAMDELPLEKFKKIKYKTIDELLKDWQVD
jgi:hypothetical protein